MGKILRPYSPTLEKKSRIVEQACASLEEMPKLVLDEPSGTLSMAISNSSIVAK